MLFALALSIAAHDASDPFGAPVVNGDWIAGCDNRGDCRLFSLPAGEDGSWGEEDDGIEVSIERAYAIDEPLAVRIWLASGAPEKGAPLILQIDGKASPFRLHWDGKAAVLEPDDALPFVRAIHSARYLAVADGDSIIGSASVAGLMPLLDYVDKEQYRQGTVGALGRPGRRPVDYVSVPPLAPQAAIRMPPLSGDPPVELAPDKFREILGTDECLQYREAGEIAQPEVRYVRLDKGKTLALVGSYCSGYNAGVRPYIIDNFGNVQPARFGHNPMIDPDERQPYLPNAWWDDEGRRLSAVGRSRGMGDCGQETSFVWNGEKFETLEYSSMPVCRGSFNYVLTYRRDIAK